MEYIRKSIYSRPEIHRTLLPLWSAWVLTGVGIVCGVLFVVIDNPSAGGASTLLGGMFLGGCALLTALCFWFFGDSRRPYQRELHAVLEPTYAYYGAANEGRIIAALETKDEKALESIKRQAMPDLALVRYSDKEERIFYSQLTRVEGKRYIPLTEIIINDLTQI